MDANKYFHHPSAIIDEGAVIKPGCKIWHFSHIMGKAILNENCKIGQNVFIGDNVVLGKNTKVQNNVSIYDGVTCEEDVFLGPSMVFTNVINPRSAINRTGDYKKTRVKKGATIGANATVVCGITIGEYAFIGAGTVLIKDVEDYELIVGNPGRHIGWMSRAGSKLKFKNGRAICPIDNSEYSLSNGQVSYLKPDSDERD